MSTTNRSSNPGSQPSRLHLAIQGILLVTALTVSTTVNAESSNDKASVKRSYHISSGELGQALRQFATNSGLLFSAEAKLTDGKTTAGLDGDYTVEEGFKKILAGTGLTYMFTADDAVAVKAVDAGSDKGTTLPPVKVVGTAVYDANDPYNLEYSRPNASTANKIDTPIMETPFSVQIVPQQILKDQQAVTLQDATKNISGVQTNFGYGNLYQAFSIRGFETNNILRNGQRASGGVGRSQVEMANIEAVEVLKGPAAMLYGRLDPGGMVNVITKKPLDTEYYSLQQQFGSFDLYRTTLDATGPLDKDKTLLYRLDYSYLDADSFQNNAPHASANFLTPSLTWRPNDKFEANVNLEYRNANPITANGIPAIGNKPANIPTTNYLQGLSSDKVDLDRKVVDFSWSYKFNDKWKIRNGLTATWDDINFANYYGSINALSDVTSQQGIGLVPWFVKRTSEGYNSFLDLNGEFETYGIQHKVLLGTDHYLLDYSDTGFINGWGPVAYQNIYNPNLITWKSLTSNAQVGQQAPDWTNMATAQWNGVYLQDQMKIMDKLHILLGGRYDSVDTNGGSITLEYAKAGSTLNDVKRHTVKDEKFSPRVGLVYQAMPWLSFYGNYVESLGNAGNSGAVALDNNGVPLHAQRSASYEGGLKVEAFDKRLLSTLAFFEIDKTNMATRDLNSLNPNAQINSGAARSRGIEFDITGAITDSLSLIGSYAHIDARFTQNNDGLQGHQIANSPQDSGSIWAKYQLIPNQLSLGWGGNFRGTRQGNNENTFQMPGYATMDTFISYNFKILGRSKLTTQLNVNNILDKRYFINSNVYDADPRLGIMPGQPLTFMGSIKLEF